MRFFLLMAAVSLLSCGQNSSPAAKEKADTTTSKIKPDTATTAPTVKTEPVYYKTPGEDAVNQMLSAKFGTSWHVVNDREAKWMKEAFDYFIVPKRKDYPDYPYITKGDFNGDGKSDVAAVVTDSTKNHYQVAILLGPDNIKFWDEDILVNAALSTMPKAETITQGDIETGKVKKIKMGFYISGYVKSVI